MSPPRSSHESSVLRVGSPRKRPRVRAEQRTARATAAAAAAVARTSSRHALDAATLADLKWAPHAKPFEGDEDELYEYIAQPAIWSNLLLAKPRTYKYAEQAKPHQRLAPLHATLRDSLDASGFVLWRSFPPLAPPTLTLRMAKLPPRSLALPHVRLRQHSMPPSTRFGSDWELRSHPSAATDAPEWVGAAHALIIGATFCFAGEPLHVVDDDWVADKLHRDDAITHALCETAGGRLVAACLETALPAARTLRSLTLADATDEMLWVECVVAAERGAAYRLIRDLIESRRRAASQRRLNVMMMAVVSSEVLGSYARWNFAYGGMVARGADEPIVVVNKLHDLASELARFEKEMRAPGAAAAAAAVAAADGASGGIGVTNSVAVTPSPLPFGHRPNGNAQRAQHAGGFESLNGVHEDGESCEYGDKSALVGRRVLALHVGESRTASLGAGGALSAPRPSWHSGTIIAHARKDRWLIHLDNCVESVVTLPDQTVHVGREIVSRCNCGCGRRIE